MRYTSRGLRRRRGSDKWDVTLTHRDPLSGDPVPTYHTVEAATRKKAERARDELILELERSGEACNSKLKLSEFLEKDLGLRHFRFKRGYKNVINKGIELNWDGENCPLAIETSGHGAFRENYFSDDGAYLSVRIICRLAVMKREGKELSSLIASLKNPAESKERRFSIVDQEGDSRDYRQYGTEVLEAFRKFAEAEPLFHVVEPNYEGVRISFDDPELKGWMLLRKSLHDPVMPMNLESEKAGGTDIILQRIQPFLEQWTRLSAS
jgi:phosphomannomutase